MTFNSFTQYMNHVAILNYTCNFELYAYENDSFDLYNDAINGCLNSRELAKIERELIEYC